MKPLILEDVESIISQKGLHHPIHTRLYYPLVVPLFIAGCLHHTTFVQRSRSWLSWFSRMQGCPNYPLITSSLNIFLAWNKLPPVFPHPSSFHHSFWPTSQALYLDHQTQTVHSPIEPLMSRTIQTAHKSRGFLVTWLASRPFNSTQTTTTNTPPISPCR